MTSAFVGAWASGCENGARAGRERIMDRAVEATVEDLSSLREVVLLARRILGRPSMWRWEKVLELELDA